MKENAPTGNRLLFCNARHHANEISSTNACFKTAWSLATTLQGQEMLRDVNVIFIPIENTVTPAKAGVQKRLE